MNVPLLDLKRQFATIRSEIEAAIGEVIESQVFILGPKVKELETAIAAYSGCSHAVGVSSGTDALLIALMAEQIGSGDEVITTPYTFFATAGSISRLGAVPVFVDIDPVTFNICPDLIEKAITRRTRALMPVHLFGQVADMDPIMEIARKHKLVVIEDAAQAIGAEYKGRRAGSIGEYGCFSFFPSKNLGGFGDGGIVTTNDPARAERLTILRAHGSKPKYYHKVVGGNFRLDALQAAIVHVKLRHLDSWTQGRQDNAGRYDRLFGDSGLLDKGCVETPVSTVTRHIYNQYVIRARDRNGLQAFLKENGVGTEVYYPVPLHLQECFASLGHPKGAFPESEKAALESLALPVFPELRPEEMAYIVDTIKRFYHRT